MTASRRPQKAGGAAVTSDHPAATAAGVEVLREGGNAVDAAVTMAAAIAVLRPHMNGLGGDAFALIRTSAAEVHALNASGRAGSRATLAAFAERGLEAVPEEGVLPVTVPGVVRGWADALERFGTFPLSRALEPAVRLARDGFAVSDKLARDIEAEADRLARDPALAAIYLPGGAPPRAGAILRNPDLAGVLALIAREGADSFYRGDVAERLAAFLQGEGGLVTLADLQAHTSTWVEPIETTYRGLRVLTCPPNSQGLALLEALNLAGIFDLAALRLNSAEYIHTLLQVRARAFADRDRWVTDPDFVQAPLELLLSKEHARELAVGIGPDAPPALAAGHAGDGDTVYLAALDSAGNAVSWIQSIYASFGCGRLVPGTGIVLHNRGALFSLDPARANVIAPGKRTYHTLMPALGLNADGSLACVFGTPGADGQPQTMLQVINNLTVFGMSPRAAVEAPRWRGYPDGSVLLEPEVPEEVASRLRALGYAVAVREGSAGEFGSAQVIRTSPDGRPVTGADPRREAQAVVL